MKSIHEFGGEIDVLNIDPSDMDTVYLLIYLGLP